MIRGSSGLTLYSSCLTVLFYYDTELNSRLVAASVRTLIRHLRYIGGWQITSSTWPVMLMIFQFRHTMFNINLNRWGTLLIHHCWRSVSKGVPGRDSNPGLPYSKSTHYCLSCAAPTELRRTVWAAPHPKLPKLYLWSVSEELMASQFLIL